MKKDPPDSLPKLFPISKPASGSRCSPLCLGLGAVLLLSVFFYAFFILEEEISSKSFFVCLVIFGFLVGGIVFALSKRLENAQGKLQALEYKYGQEHYRFDSILSHNPAVIFTCSMEDGFPIRYISPNVEKITGYTPQQFIADHGFWLNQVHPEDRKLVFKDASLLLHLGERIQDYRLRHKDGRYRWIRDEICVLKDEKKQPLELIGNWVDITSRKISEQILRESEERFHFMAEHAPIMIWVSNQKGGCVFFNQTWLEFRGRSLVQEMGHGWFEGVHPQDQEYLREILYEARSKYQPFDVEYRLRCYDASYAWVRTKATPRYLRDGTFFGYIGSSSDVSELRNAIEAIKKVEIECNCKLACYSQKLLEPVRDILAFSETLTAAKVTPLAISLLRDKAEHMELFLNSMIDVSRILSGMMHLLVHTVDLPKVLKSGCDYMEEHLGRIPCRFDIDEALPRIVRMDDIYLMKLFRLITASVDVESTKAFSLSIQRVEKEGLDKMQFAFTCKVSRRLPARMTSVAEHMEPLGMILASIIVKIMGGECSVGLSEEELSFHAGLPLITVSDSSFGHL
ncbi:MAG: PAS domain-containing protein [Opitutales bacterium]|nr:PAS domain-containing protein [Opitutales bacterium]